jgi:hypothetical protein
MSIYFSCSVKLQSGGVDIQSEDNLDGFDELSFCLFFLPLGILSLIGFGFVMRIIVFILADLM